MYTKTTILFICLISFALGTNQYIFLLFLQSNEAIQTVLDGMSLHAGVEEKKKLCDSFASHFELESYERSTEIAQLSDKIAALEEQLNMQTSQNRVQMDKIKDLEVCRRNILNILLRN